MEDLFSVCGKIRLRKGEGRTLKAGGAWVYDNEIEWMSDGIIDGHLVEVLDFDDYFMGIGFINRKSKITVRMLARHTDVVDEAFIEERVRAAAALFVVMKFTQTAPRRSLRRPLPHRQRPVWSCPLRLWSWLRGKCRPSAEQR